MDILIVVDVQGDFISGALGTKEAEQIVDNVAKKVSKAWESGAKVLFTRDTHDESYMRTEEGRNLPAPHCIEGTEGWQISSQIPWPEKFKIFDKQTFGSLELGKYLEQFNLEQDVRIEVVGLCTDICVLSNVVIAKAALPNAHIVVDAACCAGVTPASHNAALEVMKVIQTEVINQGKEPWA